MRNRNFYIDAAAVFACCVLITFAALPDNIVQLILVFIIGMSLLLLTGGKLLFAVEMLLPVLSIFVPEAIIFAPAGMFSSAANRHKFPLATGVAMTVICGIRNGVSTEFLCTAALAVLAAVLGWRSAELTAVSGELKKTRDNDTELAMALQRKNKELLIRQDNEVNVATLKERNRIAREIHDNVGHLLSRALLQSGALLAVTDKEKMAAQYTMASGLKETLTSAMNSIRESVHGLRDDSIDLHNAVKEAATSVESRFTVSTDLDFSEKMPPDVKLCFIAVVKEALSNSVKYSSGNEIRIVIREHPALYQLYITDNGKTAKISHSGGMGLNNMRERAEALGGIFQVDTSDGFRIFISIKRTEAKPNENNNS